MLVKVLGAIDMLAAIMFLMLTFGIQPFLQLQLFLAGILLVKSLFILTGEIVLSLIDLTAGIVLILSIFFTMPAVIIWTLAFLLMAKGIVSFI